jgi:hypothetical protein
VKDPKGKEEEELNMYVVINTLSVYECDLKKAPKCIEKSYDFCADGEKNMCRSNSRCESN